MSKRNKISTFKGTNTNQISYYSGKSTSNKKVILESEALEYVTKMGYLEDKAIEYVKKMGYRVTDQV